MKNKRLAVYLAFLSLLTLCSCNNDVFVDELKASATEIEMNGDGDSTTIYTNTSDWKIWSVEDTSNPEGNKFRGVAYDEDGDTEGNYNVEFYLINKAKGKLVYTGQQNGFTVKVTQTEDMESVKRRLKVPKDLEAVPSATVAGISRLGMPLWRNSSAAKG